MEQAWTIASGKGGVGKSTLAAALAVALVNNGHKTVIVDMDMGLRSLDIHLGMENSVVYDIKDYLQGNCKLMDAVLTHLAMPSLGLLPASQLGTAKDIDAEKLKTIIEKLTEHFDYILLDAPSGMERGLDVILESTDHTLLVVTADDVSIRDAERLVTLCEQKQKNKPMMIVNRILPELVAGGEMYTPQTIADTLDVPLLGYVPEDPTVLQALLKHQTVMGTDCPARWAIERITKRFLGYAVPMADAAEVAPKGIGKWFSGFRNRGGEAQ